MNNLFLFLLLTLAAYAAHGDSVHSKRIFSSTFYHDKSYCQVQGKKLDIEIRGNTKYGSADIEYGEHVFLIHNGNFIHLPLNQDGLSRYRFFNSRNNTCTKSILMDMGNDQIALFFLKDNRPMGHTLSVVHYNLKDSKVSAIETSFFTQKALIKDGLFFFQTSPFSLNVNMGQVKVNHANLIFKEEDLRLWHTYDGRNFKIDRLMTYQSFDKKAFFKKREDFENAFHWNSKTQQYDQIKYFFAFKRSDNLECMSFDKANWLCPTQNK